jgi:hypothetical protein
MSEPLSSPRISRRSLLRGGAAAALAAGLPPFLGAAGRPPGAGIANVHVSHDHYGVHIEPSVAANPRHPRQLLAACQASPTANPQLIATYLSFDAGATWQNGALPRPPAGQAPPSDDVTVAFDPQGRGYLCATRASNTPGGRAMFVWRTDDGGAASRPRWPWCPKACRHSITSGSPPPGRPLAAQCLRGPGRRGRWPPPGQPRLHPLH